MTTFIHIGDTHLQSTSGRNATRLRALDQIIDEGLHVETLGAWLWPGDIFHGRSSVDDRNALAERLQRMAGRAPVVIGWGNHDVAGDLQVFARLRAAWPIYVISQPQTIDVPMPTGGSAAVFCLPYPTRAGLIAANVPANEILSEGRQALEAIVRQGAADLGRAIGLGALPVMIGHVNVAGSITCPGQPAIGQEIELDAALLALLPPCYRGLNHIHRAQDIGGACYAGSIAPMDYGEMEPKSYVRVDYDGVRLAGVTRCPINVPGMWHVEGQLTRDDFRWTVTKGPGGEPQDAPASWADCDVRVRYRFPTSERELLDVARVRAVFAAAARLELEPVAVPDRALRAPAVAAAVTLPDKIRAWCDYNQVPCTDALLQKLARLEHGDATHLLSELATALAEPAAAAAAGRAA